MKNFLLLLISLMLLIACDSPPSPAKKEKKAISDYVLHASDATKAMAPDTLAALAKTIGAPLAFGEGVVRFVYKESLFEIPLDSAIAWKERPSFFRDPEKKLADYLIGDVPEVFIYEIYDPFPDTSVDSVELDYYQLNFQKSDLLGNDRPQKRIERGHASLRVRNQHTKSIIALEFLVNVKRRSSKGGNCLIEPYTKTIKVEHTLPPFSQTSFIHSNKELGLEITCSDRRMNEVPYKADFKLMRYQIEGDTSWVDATVRRVIGK